MLYKMLPGLEKKDHQIRSTHRRKNTTKQARVNPKRRYRLKNKMHQQLSKRLRNMRLVFYAFCLPALILFALMIVNYISEIWTARDAFGSRSGGFAIGAMVLGLLLTISVITDIHATQNRLDKIQQ